jgi:hypothetical protein
MNKLRMKVNVKLNYRMHDGVILSEFVAVCKDITVKKRIDQGASIYFDVNGKMFWSLKNGETLPSAHTGYFFFNFLDTNPNSSKYLLVVIGGELRILGSTNKDGSSSSVPFHYQNTVFNGVCYKDMKEEDRPVIPKLKNSEVSDRHADPQNKPVFTRSRPMVVEVEGAKSSLAFNSIAKDLRNAQTELTAGQIVDVSTRKTIDYVAIRITSRDDKTFYTEYSMHEPNRHENVKERIKKQTGKRPEELGTVEEGFKTYCGLFLNRKQAMDLFRQGKLRNRLDFRYGKPDDENMQSTYLW